MRDAIIGAIVAALGAAGAWWVGRKAGKSEAFGEMKEAHSEAAETFLTVETKRKADEVLAAEVLRQRKHEIREAAEDAMAKRRAKKWAELMADIDGDYESTFGGTK